MSPEQTRERGLPLAQAEILHRFLSHKYRRIPIKLNLGDPPKPPKQSYFDRTSGPLLLLRSLNWNITSLNRNITCLNRNITSVNRVVAADFDIVDQPAGFEKVDRSLTSVGARETVGASSLNLSSTLITMV